MLSTEVFLAVAAAIGLGLGLLLSEWRRGKRDRHAILTDAQNGETRPLTIGEFQLLSSKVAGGLRDAILGPIGGMRRDLDDIAELLGKVEVLLRDAVGRAAGDREMTRQRQELSETSKQELRAELMGMRKGFERMSQTLHTSAGQIATAIQHFENRVEEIFR